MPTTANEPDARRNGVPASAASVNRPLKPGDEEPGGVREAAVAMTADLFSEPPHVYEEDDPEILGVRYTVLRVEPDGSRDEVGNPLREWARRLARIPGVTPGRYVLYPVRRD